MLRILCADLDVDMKNVSYPVQRFSAHSDPNLQKLVILPIWHPPVQLQIILSY